MLSIIITLLAGPVALTRSPAIRPGLSSYPRIAHPRTAPERRINAALARLDARVRRAVGACLTASNAETGERLPHLDWRRTVTNTMRGPAFLSFAVEDEVDCGGMYRSESHAAIVYDLATGDPVDWRRLLPARLTGSLGLDEGPDGVKVVTLASPRLTRLYNERYTAALRAQGSPTDCGPDEPADGPASVQPMLAWLDPRGLVLRYDLNHAMQACSAPALIPTAVLRREGASPRLLAALATVSRR